MSKKKKKYKVTFYYHTNMTIEVKAFSENEAIDMARNTNTKVLKSQIMDGLQEYGSPDVEEVLKR